MPVLVLIDSQRHAESSTPAIHPASLSAITAAHTLNQPIHALVIGAIGDNIHALAARVASTAGIARVLCCEDAYYAHPLAERLAPLIAHIMKQNGYSHLLAGTTGVGKNVLPRVAALLDVMPISQVTAIIDAKTFEHAIYAGRVLETVQAQQAQQVLNISPLHFAPARGQQAPADIVAVPAVTSSEVTAEVAELTEPSQCLAVKTEKSTQGGAPSLAQAKVVVAGGGGLHRAEEFNGLLKPLAQQLGAAIGASRLPIANGFCDSRCLIGQTGQTVAPELYLAIGISGANQHVVGMKASKVIIAINADKHAPIFRYADYGLVMDVKKALPALCAQLSARSVCSGNAALSQDLKQHNARCH